MKKSSLANALKGELMGVSGAGGLSSQEWAFSLI